MTAPALVNLGNWRESPYCQWAFQHVDQLIECETIKPSLAPATFDCEASDFSGLRMPDSEDNLLALEEWLQWSHTDSLMVLKEGAVAMEWFAPHCEPGQPHLLFSVSKSITGLLAGILRDKGLLSFDSKVTDYLPALHHSGYAGATVQHLLDMTVSLDFDESYLDSDGPFARYRESTGWNPPGAETEPLWLKAFLGQIPGGERSHGEVFHYLSPNSDVLGWLCEVTADMPLANALSSLLWRPMGATHGATITLDGERTPRAAGGISAVQRDLGLVGELMRKRGHINGAQVVSEAWVEETLTGGSVDAWRQGNFSHLFPQGRYHNQWYQVGSESGAFCAIGIHGQWIYVDPTQATTIVKLSSQPQPVIEPMDFALLRGFELMSGFID